MMDYELRVDPEHFDYLKIQKGNLDAWSHDPAEWHRRYVADIRGTFDAIAPSLPAKCTRFLDVGSGLGGIDVLLWRHYRARAELPVVTLLDGHDDPPVMNLHRETFNHARVARNFQVKNGVGPLQIEFSRTTAASLGGPFDLVCSFGSWCFHYAPAVYLARVMRSVHAATVFILDVRTGKPGWVADLERVLEPVATVASRPKWRRMVFGVRGDVAARFAQ